MSQNILPAAWLQLLSDPYAVLGISVNADEHQILKRYRALAKQLHPDCYAQSGDAEQKLATAIFTRLINPAYEQIKHTQRRAETLATLRLEAKSLPLKAVSGQNPVVDQLMAISGQEAEGVYETAIAAYAQAQYTSLQSAYQVTQQLILVNLVYLSLQQQERSLPITSPVQHPPEDKTPNAPPVPINYAQRHYQRAIQYTKQAKWPLAMRELRDAIKLEPNNSDFYALLGLVHFHQKFFGMAKVYTRQALKLNPQNRLALKYAQQLQINPNAQIHPQSMAKAVGIAALLGKFISR